MMKRKGIGRKYGVGKSGVAEKGRPVVVHGTGYKRKGRASRGGR